MNWWAVGEFIAGWLSCWYLNGKIVRFILRRSKRDTVRRSLRSMPQDSLKLWKAGIDAELEERRT